MLCYREAKQFLLIFAWNRHADFQSSRAFMINSFQIQSAMCELENVWLIKREFMVNLGEKNWERICGFEIKKSFRCLKKDFQSDICKKTKFRQKDYSWGKKAH